MKIILKEDIANLGYKDDVVEVKSGYGRNYLIPMCLPAHRPLYRSARPAGKPPQQADPCGQPWAGLCLPAADSYGVPGLGGYQQYQHGQLAEQAG